MKKSRYLIFNVYNVKFFTLVCDQTLKYGIAFYAYNMATEKYFVYVATILSTSLVTSLKTIPKEACVAHHQKGDYLFGGIFPIYRSASPPCSGGQLFQPGVSMAESMLYAVNKINQRDDILPNITLGVELRNDCSDEEIALWTTNTLVSPVGNLEYKDACPGQSIVGNNRERKLIGIVGTSRSATSLFAAKSSAVYRVPLVSYTATSDELSDTKRFPYFLRTVAPDKFQAIAIVDLLLHFNWKYIALFYSIDTYGVHGARHVRTLAENAGICIAVNFPVVAFDSESQAIDIVSKLQEASKADVIVLISYSRSANVVLRAIKESDLNKHYTFVGSDGWGDYVDVDGYADLVHGGILIRLYSGIDKTFRQYYDTLSENIATSTRWYKNLLDDLADTNNCTYGPVCPRPQPTLELLVMNAVYALAYGLHDLIQSGLCKTPSKCGNDTIGEYFRQYLFNVSFDTPEGRFEFDENGDTSGKYFYKNVQKVEGKSELVEVGLWHPGNTKSRLSIDESLIQWGPEPMNAKPVSQCKEVCKSGHIVVPLRQKCCLGCVKCSDFAIVSENRTACIECSLSEWPNGNSSSCEKIQPTTLDTSNVIILIISLFAGLGLMLTIVAAIGIWYYREHPLIKATSRELSSINIMGLVLAFIVPFLMMVKPTAVSCSIAEICITLCLSLNFVPVLLKVNRIWRIFQAGGTSVKPPRFVGPKQQLIIVAVVILFQVINLNE